MPYNATLAERLHKLLAKRPNFTSKKMFGGVGFFLKGKMCVGVHREALILRLGVEQAAAFLAKPHVRPMDLTGKVMKGWVMIDPPAWQDDPSLQGYCEKAIAFCSDL